MFASSLDTSDITSSAFSKCLLNMLHHIVLKCRIRPAAKIGLTQCAPPPIPKTTSRAGLASSSSTSQTFLIALPTLWRTLADLSTTVPFLFETTDFPINRGIIAIAVIDRIVSAGTCHFTRERGEGNFSSESHGDKHLQLKL